MERLPRPSSVSSDRLISSTPTAMDGSYCSALQLQENAFLFDCDESLLEKPYDPAAYNLASDSGYFSAGSSLSPTSSVDSFCFSPASLQAAGNEQDALDCFLFGSHEAQTQPGPGSSETGRPAKKSRSRYPGKKRQTASEREKLRMRDLTRALHHLRTYLPPSVAPAGQTLTKIETLRLTIRYISYLSAQLGLSEEVLEQRRCSGSTEQPQTLSQFLGQEPDCDAVSTAPPAHCTYQVSGGFGFSGDPVWSPQQQLQNVSFCGRR